MFSLKSIVLIAAAFTIGAESSAVPAVAAPLVGPAIVGYAHGIPQNVPPFADQVSVVNRGLSPLVSAPGFPPAAYAAAAPLVAGPFVSGPAPVFPAPYSLPGSYAAAYGAPGPYAAPYPYSASLLRSPYFAAPAFVR